MRRRQRVVLRDKVRRARWAHLQSSILKVSRSLLFLLMFFWASFHLHRFLLRSDFFVIKSVEIKPEGEMTLKMSEEISRLKGQSILWISPQRIEGRLKDTYPEIQTLRVRRILPDKVRVGYVLRKPLAFVRIDGDRKGVDQEGKIFPLVSTPESSSRNLPELAFKSKELLPQALQFVQMWNASGGEQRLGLSRLSERKIALDETGEIDLYFRGNSAQTDSLRIIWGASDSEVFSEKLERLNQVWDDLRRKSLKVSLINLRGVPQTGGIVLNERQMVGRVVVRPYRRERMRVNENGF